MKDIKKRTVAMTAGALLLTAGLVSCSVKEDRVPCPVALFFDVTEDRGLRPEALARVSVAYENGVPIGDEPLEQMEVVDSRDFCMRVHKQHHALTGALIGQRRMQRSGSTFRIPLGSPCDTIYHFHAETDIGDEEEITLPVRVTKEHSILRIIFRSDSLAAAPYALALRSNTDGIDLYTGKPTRGDFYVVPAVAAPGEFETLIPRQADDSMTMDLYMDSTFSERIASLPLSKYLDQIAGFSWDMESLVDITIYIDFARGEMTLVVEDWDAVFIVKIF